jgi:hypothetical protein
MLLLHDQLYSVHDLLEQVPVNLNCPSLHNLLDSALPSELLVTVGVAPQHFDQLMGCNQIVEHNDVLRIHRYLGLRVLKIAN